MGEISPIARIMSTDIPSLVKRAERVAKVTRRSDGGISKALFGDVRTLGLLRDGWRGIRVNRLARGEAHLAALEARAFPKRGKAKRS